MFIFINILSYLHNSGWVVGFMMGVRVCYLCRLRMLNATFNNNSVKSWRSVLTVKETGLPYHDDHKVPKSRCNTKVTSINILKKTNLERQWDKDTIGCSTDETCSSKTPEETKYNFHSNIKKRRHSYYYWMLVGSNSSLRFTHVLQHLVWCHVRGQI